jgi:glycosyltransferase involved in cell wall biosynthesis
MSARIGTGNARQLGYRLSRASGILRQEGPRALAQRITRIAYTKLDAASLSEPLLDADIADSTQLELAIPASNPPTTQRLRVGWVTVPPAAGSGGHTTLFRMVEAVERAGHDCVLFLYDRYAGDLATHERVIREWWPNLRAKVRDAADGVHAVDACVASSWDTAHVLAARGTEPMRRLYFIQDYEPFFYARGALYALAEDTYRFGFRCIALGEMVAQLLRQEIGIEPDVTEFGCDTSVYRLLDDRPRSGVVLYARPQVPRRGYMLARLALQRFHDQHPDQEIHIYGERIPSLPFPATQHGRLSPTELNELYNSTIAGLAMSFTNISLVAEEMLAAGTIPVVNDSKHSRADLINHHVAWATPTPQGIAAALSRAVTNPDVTGTARLAAHSVRQFGWAKAQADVVKIIEDEVYGHVQAVPAHRDAWASEGI